MLKPSPKSRLEVESRLNRGTPRLSAFLSGLLVATTTLLPGTLWAQNNDSFATTPRLRSELRNKEIYLAPLSGVLVGVEGYGGLTTLTMDHETLGRAYGGATIHVRFSRIEFSGFAESSDYTNDKWRLFGGAIGTFLHFHNWVDLDGSVGLGQRSYISLDNRFGTAGAYESVPSLILRLGLSDRITDGTVAPRIGASLYSGIDLSHKTSRWNYEVDGTTLARGTTRFGGITVGLMMSFGIDFALGRTS